MGSADAVVVSLPHRPETVDFLAASPIRRGAVIVKDERGPMMDEAELLAPFAGNG